jgi:hypothetical protein
LVQDFELYVSISHEGEDISALDWLDEALEYLSETYHQEGWPVSVDAEGQIQFDHEVEIAKETIQQYAAVLVGAYFIHQQWSALSGE